MAVSKKSGLVEK